jgi:hypothetical protein
LVFLVLNVTAAYAIFPSTRGSIVAFLDLGAADQLAIWFMGLISTYVLGILIWSLNPWLRQFLEGRYLPYRLRDYLEGIQYRELNRLTESKQDLLEDLFHFRKVTLGKPSWRELLIEARQEGERVPATGVQLPKALADHLKALKESQGKWRLIHYSEMEQLFHLLESELKRRPASKAPELDDLHKDFLDLLEYASDRAEIPRMTVSTELNLRFPQNTVRLGPTALANLAEVHREYGLQRYGLDVEVFWLRLLKIVKADSDFYPILDDAKTQLDFSVAMTAILGFTTALWFLPSMLLARNLYPYLIVAAIGPLATAIFYRIVFQNYRTFSEAVRSAVDLYRFDLLRALNIELPGNSTEEKDIFRRLTSWPVDETDPITYQHGTQEAPEKPEQPRSVWSRSVAGLKKWMGVK